VTSVGFHAILLAMSPCVEIRSAGFSDLLDVTIQPGLLPVDLLASLWDEVRDAVTRIDAASWGHLTAALAEWIYPEYAIRSPQVPKELVEGMHRFARKVLHDLSALAAGNPGLAAGLRRLARTVGSELDLESDPIFEVLFPEQGTVLAEPPGREAARRVALGELAAQWAAEEPPEVAARLKRYEREADCIGHRWPRFTPELCAALARETAAPERWVGSLVDVEASYDLLVPFLQRLVADRRSAWAQQQLARCLAADRYAWVTTSVLLRVVDLPQPLLEQALQRAAQFSRPGKDTVLAARGSRVHAPGTPRPGGRADRPRRGCRGMACGWDEGSQRGNQECLSGSDSPDKEG
jgi:hypothetical protein